MTWHHTAHVRAVLNNIAPADLHPRWVIDAGSYDRFVLTGEPVPVLQALLTAHVIQIAGCTLHEAERRGQCGAWMALLLSEPSVEQVLNERFGDPNTLGLRMPLRAGSWERHAEWDRVFRSQFPVLVVGRAA